MWNVSGQDVSCTLPLKETAALLIASIPVPFPTSKNATFFSFSFHRSFYHLFALVSFLKPIQSNPTGQISGTLLVTMVPRFRNLDTDSVDSQAVDDIFPMTPSQKAMNESPSSPPIFSTQTPTRVPDTPRASHHGQNTGHRRRSTTTIGGRLAALRRRFPVMNSLRDSQRSVDRTPNRVVRQYRRMRTLGNNQRSGSFLQYISSVEDLSRAIAGVQPTDPPEHGNRRLIAIRASRLRSIFRNRQVQVCSWQDPQTPTPVLVPHMIGQLIHTYRPQPSRPPTSRVIAPPAEPMPEPSRLSMDSRGSTGSGVTEHDTQPSVRQNRPRWPGHVLYCDCVICDKLNEPYSP